MYYNHLYEYCRNKQNKVKEEQKNKMDTIIEKLEIINERLEILNKLLSNVIVL